MKIDVAIIGAGVVGCAAASELSRYALRVGVLEAQEDVCCGTSKANSAIVHAGFDAKPGSRKAAFNVAGSRRMEALCARLDVPYRRCGALVLAPEASGRAVLEGLLAQGVENGVEGLRIVTGEELYALEPNLAPGVAAALYAPSSAIVCPFELTAALAENAAGNGCAFRFDAPVTALAREGDGWVLTAGGERIEARCVVNAAGVAGDTLHNLVSAEKLSIIPRRGEYCLLDRKAGSIVSRTIFQLPGKMGKGVLVTPTVHGNTLMGPTAADIGDKGDTATTAAGLAEVMDKARQSVPTLPLNRTITSFAGLRAHLAGESSDFRVGWAADAPGFLDALGIESPGLSSAPAIGAYIARLCAAYLSAPERPDYLPGRETVVRPAQLSPEARQRLIREQPAYGQIVCRCEGVTEGEILAAIRRHPGARSLDGVKRRTRAGMGRCQGGFCAPRVMELLARELGTAQTELTKNGRGRLLAGLLREEAEQ